MHLPPILAFSLKLQAVHLLERSKPLPKSAVNPRSCVSYFYPEYKIGDAETSGRQDGFPSRSEGDLKGTTPGSPASLILYSG